MKYIAHLDLAVNNSLKGERWRALATEIGAPLRDYDGPVGATDRIADFIRNATGLVLPYENFLLSPELVDTIRAGVADGIPLLVWIEPSSIDKLNPFLIEYGFEGTRLAIHGDTGTDSRIVALSRQESPNAFHPHPLLDGVKGIPLPIRQKCEQRGEEEGNKIVKEAYLDLLDVKTILEKNWRLFERHLAVVGWVGRKGSALAWFNELNDIRKNVMHPVRRHFVPSLVDNSTIEKLTGWLRQIQRLSVPSGGTH